MFEEEKPPGRGPIARTRDLVKAAASAAGGPLGAVAVELLDQLVRPVFRARRDAWLEDLAHRVKQLEKERGITLEDLKKNPAFLDAVFRASEAAVRTHQEEKREALRNAVLNSALPSSPAEDRQQMFISIVERLTPSHLKILKLIAEGVAQREPNIYASTENTLPLHQVLQREHPQLAKDREFRDLVCTDLESLGLIKKPPRGGGFTELPMVLLAATGFGKEFLKFISPP